MCVEWKDGGEGWEECKEKKRKSLKHFPGFLRREGCASEQLETSSKIKIMPSWGRGAV